MYNVISRPVVAGVVLKLIKSSFYSKYSTHHNSESERARELKEEKNVQESRVLCHVSGLKFHNFNTFEVPRDS